MPGGHAAGAGLRGGEDHRWLAQAAAAVPRVGEVLSSADPRLLGAVLHLSVRDPGRFDGRHAGAGHSEQLKEDLRRARCEEYRDLSGVNLASLLVAGLVSTSLMVSILLLVYLGNEATAGSIGASLGT